MADPADPEEALYQRLHAQEQAALKTKAAASATVQQQQAQQQSEGPYAPFGKFLTHFRDSAVALATALNPEQITQDEQGNLRVPPGWHPEAQSFGDRLTALANDLPVVHQINQLRNGQVAEMFGDIAPALGGFLPGETVPVVGTALKGAVKGTVKGAAQAAGKTTSYLPLVGAYTGHPGLAEISAIPTAIRIGVDAVRGAKAELAARAARQRPGPNPQQFSQYAAPSAGPTRQAGAPPSPRANQTVSQSWATEPEPTGPNPEEFSRFNRKPAGPSQPGATPTTQSYQPVSQSWSDPAVPQTPGATPEQFTFTQRGGTPAQPAPVTGQPYMPQYSRPLFTAPGEELPVTEATPEGANVKVSLDDVAQGQYGVKFNKLPPEKQMLARSIADRINGMQVESVAAGAQPLVPAGTQPAMTIGMENPQLNLEYPPREAAPVETSGSPAEPAAPKPQPPPGAKVIQQNPPQYEWEYPEEMAASPEQLEQLQGGFHARYKELNLPEIRTPNRVVPASPAGVRAPKGAMRSIAETLYPETEFGDLSPRQLQKMRAYLEDIAIKPTPVQSPVPETLEEHRRGGVIKRKRSPYLDQLQRRALNRGLILNQLR